MIPPISSRLPSLVQLRRRCCWLAVLLAALIWPGVPDALAQSPAKGSIEGQVLNISSQLYLEKARVTIPALSVQQFTDNFGQYRFSDLPAGTYVVEAFYTGMQKLQREVVVAPGEASRQNFGLTAYEGLDSETVKLEKYVVATGRTMSGPAIAINEQRYGSNLKNVVATSEYGENPPGDFDISEFMKFIPGADGTRIRGMPESMTPVSIDGNRVASSSNSNDSRIVSMDNLLLNNISRIEVTKVPTPDNPADAIGGSVNFVSKSAFERVNPEFSYRTSANWVHSDGFSFKKTPGPYATPSVKVRPAFDFAWIVPVNKRLGFTLSGTWVESPWRQDALTIDRVPIMGIATGQTPAPPENPYIKTYQTRDSPRIAKRLGGALTVDYKLTPYDVFTLGVTYTRKNLVADFHPITFTMGTVVSEWDAKHAYGGSANGSVDIGGSVDSATGAGVQANLAFRHNGPTWKYDVGASISHDTNDFPHVSEGGGMSSFSVRIPNVIVHFDNVTEQHADVSIFDANGKPIDYYNLSNYKIQSAADNHRESVDQYRMVRANIGRDFHLGIPLKFKAGVEIRENLRKVERPTASYTFVGADRIANTADDSAAILLDPFFSRRPSPYGFPQLFQYPSSFKMADLFRTHPEYFSIAENTIYRNTVNNSKRMMETVSAAYLRLDTNLIDNRLRITTGVRYERTDDDGYGPLNDADLVPAGTTGALAIDKFQFVRQGAHSKVVYGSFYPSLNATYDVTSQLVLRLGYARTIARPDLSAIIPGATVPDPDSTSRTITINNTTLKPWQSNNLDATLEYYFKQAGVASVGVFRKDITDFFGAVTTPATPELLTPYGIDPVVFSAANGYVVSTQLNSGSASVQGMEVSYKQNLTFLPAWASGLQVHSTYTKFFLDGLKSPSLTSYFTPRMYTIGLILTKKKFNIAANVTAVGRHRYALLTGTGIPADTYNQFYGPQVYTVSGAYVIDKHLQLFFSAKNLGSRGFFNERYSPTVPGYAQFRNQTQSPANFAVGIKGSY